MMALSGLSYGNRSMFKKLSSSPNRPFICISLKRFRKSPHAIDINAPDNTYNNKDALKHSLHYLFIWFYLFILFSDVYRTYTKG